MLLVQSFIVYTVFALLLFFFSKIAAKQHASKRGVFSLPIGFWLCIFIFTLISAIRWDVGVDYLGYYETYCDALAGLDWQRNRGFERGFSLVVNAFASMGIHPTIFFAFFAFFQVFFVVLAMRKDVDVMPFMLLVLVLNSFYLTWMNGIRQMLVACAFVWFSQYIQKKEILPYLLFIAVSFTFHRSSIILLPVFLLCFDRSIWGKTWLNIGLVLICLILGNNPIWISSFEQVGDLLSFIGYDYYEEQLDQLLDPESFRQFTFGPRKIVLLVSFIISISLYPKYRVYFRDTNIDLFFKLFLIGICGAYLFENTLVVFKRPVRYFDIFALPIFGYTLYYLHKYSKNRILFFIMLISCISFLYLQCIAEYNTPELFRKSTLFQFYFNNA